MNQTTKDEAMLKVWTRVVYGDQFNGRHYIERTLYFDAVPVNERQQLNGGIVRRTAVEIISKELNTDVFIIRSRIELKGKDGNFYSAVGA